MDDNVWSQYRDADEVWGEFASAQNATAVQETSLRHCNRNR